jgi:hypothetical protein
MKRQINHLLAIGKENLKNNEWKEAVSIGLKILSIFPANKPGLDFIIKGYLGLLEIEKAIIYYKTYYNHYGGNQDYSGGICKAIYIKRLGRTTQTMILQESPNPIFFYKP